MTHEIKERIDYLTREVERHNRLYHGQDKPEISDAEYDTLYHELKRLEEQHPQYQLPNSPTMKVGFTPLGKFEKVQHDIPLLSLNNAFTEQDVIDFDKRVCEASEPDLPWYFTDFKYDGLAIKLKYVNGRIVEASTRGDGHLGENVTSNVLTISSIPKDTSDTILGNASFEVRGEAVLPKVEFARLNAFRAINGEDLYANPRNAVAGLIRQLDPNVTRDANIEFYAYDLIYTPEDPKHDFDHFIRIGRLTLAGFLTGVAPTLKATPRQLIDFYKNVLEKRHLLPYEIDGVVYRVNSSRLQKKMGYLSKAPRFAIAHKFPAEEAMTTVTAIDIQIGRTGAATPVARLAPVFVGGVTVTNATLHNEDEITRKDIRVGDTVIVRRAGDVIPEIVRSVVDNRPDWSVPFTMPKECPVCSNALYKPEGEAVARCIGEWSCPAQIQRKLVHYASREALNIEGFGPATIEELYHLGFLKTPDDFYRLDAAKLGAMEKTEEARVRNLLAAIEKSKKTTLERLLIGLGIRHANEGTAKRLVKYYKGDLDAIMNASVTELREIDDIGEVVGRSVWEFFFVTAYRDMVQDILGSGVRWDVWKAPFMLSNHLEGKSFVITGTLPTMTRERAKVIIELRGGKVSDTVSSKTAYLVVGDEPGKSKTKKAKELGTPVLDETELLKLLGIDN